MKRNARFIPLWIMFLVFGFCCAAIKTDLWILLSVWATGLSVFLLIRMKLPSKKSIIISAYVIGEEKPTKFQMFTMWFMMCFPHTAAHGYDIVSTVILCVLFGLPFTLLQRKRDLASAMISHGLVDAVRFTVFGLGL